MHTHTATFLIVVLVFCVFVFGLAALTAPVDPALIVLREKLDKVARDVERLRVIPETGEFAREIRAFAMYPPPNPYLGNDDDTN